MVLSWRLSNTLDSSFCVDALEAAIARYGCPEIFTDRVASSPGKRLQELSVQETLQSAWKGPLEGQRLYRTALEKRQVRGYLPKGLWLNGRGEERTCHLTLRSTTKSDGTKTLTGRLRL
jgi:putative transposase